MLRITKKRKREDGKDTEFQRQGVHVPVAKLERFEKRQAALEGSRGSARCKYSRPPPKRLGLTYP